MFCSNLNLLFCLGVGKPSTCALESILCEKHTAKKGNRMYHAVSRIMNRQYSCNLFRFDNISYLYLYSLDVGKNRTPNEYVIFCGTEKFIRAYAISIRKQMETVFAASTRLQVKNISQVTQSSSDTSLAE